MNAPPTSVRKTVLIHIGYPKSGSSYLQAWFDKHPSFYYKSNSVAGFYDSLEIAAYAQFTEKVHECFVLSCEDLTVWKGDIDIVGLKYRPYDIESHQKKLCETLHHLFPAANILIVTRGYESFIKSLYSEALLAGTIYKFDDFQDMFGSFLSRFCNYTTIINLYREAFGAESIILLPFELLRDNPSAFISAIETKMGIDKHIDFPPDKVNPSLSYDLQQAYVRTSGFLHDIISPLSYSLQKKIYGFYLYQLNRRKPHPLMKFYSKFMDTKSGKMQVKAETLQLFSGKGEVLRNEKLFQPYLKEYLL